MTIFNRLTSVAYRWHEYLSHRSFSSQFSQFILHWQRDNNWYRYCTWGAVLSRRLVRMVAANGHCILSFWVASPQRRVLRKESHYATVKTEYCVWTLHVAVAQYEPQYATVKTEYCVWRLHVAVEYMSHNMRLLKLNIAFEDCRFPSATSTPSNTLFCLASHVVYELYQIWQFGRSPERSIHGK